MAPSGQGFFFVPYQNSGRQPHGQKDPAKNRHAQLGASRKRVAGMFNAGHVVSPAPVQVRFRIRAKDRNAGLDGMVSDAGVCSLCTNQRQLRNRIKVCIECGSAETEDGPPPQHVVYKSNGKLYQQAGRQHGDPEALTIRQVSCVIPGSPSARRALHYYLHSAALDLSGYGPVRFWSQSVPQIAYSEPVIRHALVAVSSAHYEHCNAVSLSAVSLAAYQVAINKLRGLLESKDGPRHELVLICCVLFFTFERLREDFMAASVHLKSAVAILKSARRRQERSHKWTPNAISSSESDPIRELIVLLLQIDIEDSMTTPDRGFLLQLESSSNAFHWEKPPSFNFSTPHQFSEPWMHISHSVNAFIGRNVRYRHAPIDTVPPVVVQERLQLLLWFKAWHAAVKAWFKRNLPLDEGSPTWIGEASHPRIIECLNAVTLEVHYLTIKGLMVECLDDDRHPPGFDYYAEKMLWRAEKALSLQQAYRQIHNISAGKTFSAHAGIPESLLYLSHRTRSPLVRSRTQRLIRTIRSVAGELTGLTAFFAGCGAPPKDLVFLYERPGH